MPLDICTYLWLCDDMTPLADYKRWLYEDLAIRSDPWAKIDAQWADTDDPRFYLARQIDDWLMAHREDKTTAREYQRECVRFARMFL